jgi:hypothetical protein
MTNTEERPARPSPWGLVLLAAAVLCLAGGAVVKYWPSQATKDPTSGRDAHSPRPRALGKASVAPRRAVQRVTNPPNDDTSPALGPNVVSSAVARTEAAGPLNFAPHTPQDLTRMLVFMRSATVERIPELRQALRGSDSRVVAQAAQALARLGAPLADTSLLAMLGDQRREVRHAFITGLGENADPRALPHLTGVFEREDPQGRALVIQAIGRLPTAGGKKFLLEVIKDPESTETERRLARAAVTTAPTW